jgi:hypothetical protein
LAVGPHFTYLAEYEVQTEGQTILKTLDQRGEGAIMSETHLMQGQLARQEATVMRENRLIIRTRSVVPSIFISFATRFIAFYSF